MLVFLSHDYNQRFFFITVVVFAVFILQCICELSLRSQKKCLKEHFAFLDHGLHPLEEILAQPHYGQYLK